MTSESYPRLPAADFYGSQAVPEDTPLYTADQMRAYVDADRAARTAAAPAGAVQSSAPERIYLDIGDRFTLKRVQEGACRWDALAGVTWSQDNATGHGIEYVRAAAPASQQGEPDMPERSAAPDFAHAVAQHADHTFAQYLTGDSPPEAAPQGGGGADAFAAYLKDCDENAIEPDVAGAFNWAWQRRHGAAQAGSGQGGDDADALDHVWALLPTWSAEDWSELLERNPHISPLLRPLVNAKCSAPPEGWECSRAPGHGGPCAAVAAPTGGDAQVVADAARYRWLRAAPGPELKYGNEQYTRVCSVCHNYGDELDAAIDAARQQGGA